MVRAPLPSDFPRSSRRTDVADPIVNICVLNNGILHRYASERLTREQALKGMTLDAAYASFSETELGSLTPGKKADFVVLDTDIMTVPVRRILDAKVTATVIDGELGYGSLS